MQIQINANHTVRTTASTEEWVRAELGKVLERFQDDITSVEVHLSDVNSDRISPDHKRCLIEARVNGREPVAVNHQGERLDEALHGACDKLRRALDHALGKQRDRRSRESIRRDLGPDLA